MTDIGAVDVPSEQGVQEQAARPAQAAPQNDEPAVEALDQQAPSESPKTQVKGKTPGNGIPPSSHDPTSTGRARRERKQVEFFRPVILEKEEQPALKQGHGLKLRDIPNVAYKLGKVTGKDDLAESLHQLLFRRKGTAQTRKRDIMDFCGFAFDADEQEKEMKHRRESLGKWKLELIHRLMDCLDVPRGSGEKSAKVDRVLEFLVKPEQLSDVSLAEKDAEKREKAKAKRERESTKKEKEKAKKEKAKAKKNKEVLKKDAAPAKRKASIETKGRPAKKVKQVEPSEGEVEQELVQDLGIEASDTEYNKDPAQELSQDQLRADLEAELSKMASEELKAVNVRLLLGKLGEKYAFSVKSRKAEIKAMAVEYCNQRLAGEEAEEDGGQSKQLQDATLGVQHEKDKIELKEKKEDEQVCEDLQTMDANPAEVNQECATHEQAVRQVDQEVETGGGPQMAQDDSKEQDVVVSSVEEGM